MTAIFFCVGVAAVAVVFAIAITLYTKGYARAARESMADDKGES